MAYRNKLKVWKISPGKNAEFWSQCFKGGYIIIGWDNVGNILSYKDKASLVSEVQKKHPTKKGKASRDAYISLWYFAREIKIGDLVVANNGRSKVVGIGVVKSNYIPPNYINNPSQVNQHSNLLKIKWLVTGEKGINGAYIFGRLTCHDLGVSIEKNGIFGAIRKQTRIKNIFTSYNITIKNIFNESQKIMSQKCIEDKYNYFLDSSSNTRQIILSGPPGTSKTWQAKRIAADLLAIAPAEVDKEEKNEKNDFSMANFPQQCAKGAWAIIQFHPAYNYEDFVRGIQVSTSNGGGAPQYKTVNRIFAQMALLAHSNQDKDKKYVLIIDEINRAHLAAVLGELIYGLEYRGSKITSPYAVSDSNEQFDNIPNALIVPPNLYIIGTMNTADRSIGHIDYAVRRRFAFVPLLPDEDILKNYYAKIQNPPHTVKAKALFAAVEALFQGKNNYLSPEFYADDVQPGHTYFMTETCEELTNKFIYQVYPLLREYVKDGVLVAKDSEIELNISNITIEPVMSVADLTKAIAGYLECSAKSDESIEPEENNSTNNTDEQEDTKDA